MQLAVRVAWIVWVSLAIAACTPSRSPAAGSGPEASRQPIQRTLVAGIRTEPTSLALTSVGPSSFAGNSLVHRYFNADTTMIDDQGQVRPYLAETVPQLETDSWRVFPDGRMDVTWTFRPGIVWQDGTPFSMEDFLFAHQVYSRPELGASGSPALRAMQAVAAPTDRTLVVSYKEPFPDVLTDTLKPLPRHLLFDSFQRNDPNAFANDSYWTLGYVQLGPWKLTQWEPSNSIEGAAFDQHILGRPKIDKVRAVFVGDVNTAMAKTVSGEVHVVASGTFISISQAQELKKQWDQSSAGTIAMYGVLWRTSDIQKRPEYAKPAALLDARVRKALASAINKQEIGDAAWSGLMQESHFFFPPDTLLGAAADPVVPKYPYDLRRTEQLMNEAGFARGSDGVYANPSGRFQMQVETAEAPEWLAEMSIMADNWRKAGFDIEEYVIPAALAGEPQARVLYSGTSNYTTGQRMAVANLTGAQCPKAETNYRVGSNRGCWLAPEYDRLAALFATTLDPKGRANQVAQIARVYGEELPTIPLFYLTQPYFWVSGLQGVMGQTTDGDIKWNMFEWEWIK